MKRLTAFLVKKTIPGWQNIHDQKTRAKYGLLEGWLSIVINFLLAALKILLGLISGSIALMADAVHTLSDVLTSIVVVIAFRGTSKPSDEAHPFGHGRIEAVGTLIIAVLLIVVGVEFLKSGVQRIINPHPVAVSWIMIIAIISTAVVKEWLARFSLELGRLINSDALIADFWHHRTDVIASLLVVFAFIGQKFGIMRFDGIGGVLVALILAYTGWTIARNGINDLVGSPPTPELVSNIKNAACKYPDVLGVHDLIVHQYGQMIVLSFHIDVSDKLSLKYAHRVSENIKNAINEEFGTHTTIHLDPINASDPERNKMVAFLTEYLKSQSETLSFHDIRVMGKESNKQLFLTLVFDSHMKETERENTIQNLKHEVQKKFNISCITINIEPRYAL